MAITIHQNPGTLNPSMNSCVFVVSSTNTAQSNFQYVVDLYLSDDNGSLTIAGRTYLREKTPVDPVYSSGVFDISPLIRNFVSYDVGDDSYGWQKCPNSCISVSVKFGEEYGASSGVTVYDSLTNTDTLLISQSVDPIGFNMTSFRNSYVITGAVSSTKSPLTNRPNSGTIRTTERAWLYYETETTNALWQAKIVTYDNAGAIVQTYFINNPYAQINGAGRRMQRFPSGPANMSAIPASSIISGQTSIDFSSIYTYSISPINASSGVTAAPETYTIDQTCVEDYPVYRLHFKNKLGGFDSFSFTKVSQFSTDVQKDKFKRNTLSRIGGGRYGYNNYDLSSVQFNTKQTDKVVVKSDWIDEATSVWLEELVTSPVVFIDDATYGLIAVNPIETQHIRRQWRTDGLSTLELTLEYSFGRVRESL